MTDYTIFDLDGCLSDHHERWQGIDHTIENLDDRYEEYNTKCGHDEPINMDFFIMFLENSDSHPLIVTARPERMRQITMTWLNLHLPSGLPPLNLLMRPEKDYRHSPELKIDLVDRWLSSNASVSPRIIAAFDDRQDVITAYNESRGWAGVLLTKPRASDEVENPNSTDAILHEMARTFKERNTVYGNNYKMVGPMVDILWPDGVPASLVCSDQWHLFELILVKLSRFAISDLTHIDSIHDTAVYAAMIESLLREKV